MLNRLLVSQNEISAASGRRSNLRGELHTPKPIAGHSSDDNSPNGRRQRRRVGDNDYSLQQSSTCSTPAPASALHHKDSTRTFANHDPYLSLTDIASTSSPLRNNWNVSDVSDGETELTGAIGQLSLNEDEQVRYHGKASGLHLLGGKERVDRRNEGGIWSVFFSAYTWIFLTCLFSQGASRKLVYGLRYPQVRRS